MIINIRGTSGSGKSTLVRGIMGLYHHRSPIMVEGRKQPIGYICHSNSDVMPDLAVVGHYETPCGGCDTVPTMDMIFEEVRRHAAKNRDVIFEGLLISADLKRTLSLHTDELPLLVLGLSTPLDVCLASVNERRTENWEKRCLAVQLKNGASPGKKQHPLPVHRGPVNPKNTESKYKGVVKTMDSLQRAGVDARWGDRQELFEIIQSELACGL